MKNKITSETQYGDIIEVGMLVHPPSETDAARPSWKELEVLEIIDNGKSPNMRAVKLSNGTTYAGLELSSPHHKKNKEEGGNVGDVDITEDLENFDIDDLDPFESMQYEHHIQHMPKAEALQVLINTVEGDFSQLSPELYKVAEKQNPDWMTEPSDYKDGGELKNLYAQRTHLTDAIDGRRRKLSSLWERGIKTGIRVDHHKKMMEDDEKRLDIVNDKIFKNKDSFEEGGEIRDDSKANEIVEEYIVKLKNGETIKRFYDVRGNGKKIFETIIADKQEPGNHKRYESAVGGPAILQNAYLDENDVRNHLKKTILEIWKSKGLMAEGGEVSSDRDYATEIRNQIGNQALFMLGAKDIYADENRTSLGFKIRGSKRWKHIKIHYNVGTDMYDVTFKTWHQVKKTGNDNLKSETYDGIGVDNLMQLIRSETGLETKLFAAGGEVGDDVIYFKSKNGIPGFDKTKVFKIEKIPEYGNVKVYFTKGILENFIWFYKSKIDEGFASCDFYKVDKSEYDRQFEKGGAVEHTYKIREVVNTINTVTPNTEAKHLIGKWYEIVDENGTPQILGMDVPKVRGGWKEYVWQVDNIDAAERSLKLLQEGKRAFGNGGEVTKYIPSEHITEDQFKKFQEWAKTGKIDGIKTDNTITVAKHIGVSTASLNAYFMEQNAKDSYAAGGEIPNQYSGKSAKQVWADWKGSQRLHFITDHIKNSTPSTQDSLTKKAYNFLPKNVREALEKHISEGQYKKGGQLKMKHEKKYYQDLPVIDGFKWQGFWDGYHHFVKKEAKGYLETRATDQDIEDGNLKDMIEMGFTKAKGGPVPAGSKKVKIKATSEDKIEIQSVAVYKVVRLSIIKKLEGQPFKDASKQRSFVNSQWQNSVSFEGKVPEELQKKVFAYLTQDTLSVVSGKTGSIKLRQGGKTSKFTFKIK